MLQVPAMLMEPVGMRGLAVPASDDEIIPCPVCQKPFRSRPSLKRHLDVHQGIFRYSCPHCSKGFTYKHALQAHLISRHQAEGMKVHCPHCNKRFTRKDNMQVHIKSAHPEVVAKAGATGRTVTAM